jgi:Mor family transcriptional regulator
MATIKLSPAKVNNIRKLYQTGLFTHEQLSKKYNVSRGHITKIINQKRWNSNNYPNT